MNDFDEGKKKILQPIYFEAGAALFDCQSFEYGVGYFLYLLSRLGTVGLDPKRLTAILDDEEKKTAGQMINMLKQHVQVSENIENGLEEALKARNKLVHRILIDNVERFLNASEQDSIVSEIRELRSRVQKSHQQLQPFIEHLAGSIDDINLSDMRDQAKEQFMNDTKLINSLK